MKKILFISLALMLAACSTVQPVQQEQPSPVVATVLVTVIPPTEVVAPTDVPPPTAVPPTDVPPPTAVPPTDVPPPTADTSSSSDSSDTLIHVDNVLGKGIFSDIAFSSDTVTLNCTPREIQVTLKSAHPDVVRGEWYYRITNTVNFNSTDWFSMGRMDTDGNGNFSVELKATDINPDWRGSEKLFLDFQFIGVNKGAGVVGRTEHIEKVVTYYKECP